MSDREIQEGPIQRREIPFYQNGERMVKWGFLCPYKTCRVLRLSLHDLDQHIFDDHQSPPLMCKACGQSWSGYHALRRLVRHNCPSKGEKTSPFLTQLPLSEQVNLHGEIVNH